MTFAGRCDAYQAFTRTTAQTRCDTLHYCALGLADEAIEFHTCSGRAAEKLAELGDVMWYLARLLDGLGIALAVPASRALAAFTASAAAAPGDDALLRAAGCIAGLAKKRLRGDAALQDAAGFVAALLPHVEQLLHAAIAHAARHGDSQQEAGEAWLAQLAANQAKLTDRQRRGVIFGSGDNR